MPLYLAGSHASNLLSQICRRQSSALLAHKFRILDSDIYNMSVWPFEYLQWRIVPIWWELWKLFEPSAGFSSSRHTNLSHLYFSSQNNTNTIIFHWIYQTERGIKKVILHVLIQTVLKLWLGTFAPTRNALRTPRWRFKWIVQGRGKLQ